MNISRNKKRITAAGKYNSAIALYSAICHMTRVGIPIINANPRMSNIMATLYILLVVK